MKRVSQREETGSGWRERPEGKEEQSAERLGLAKKRKNCLQGQNCLFKMKLVGFKMFGT